MDEGKRGQVNDRTMCVKTTARLGSSNISKSYILYVHSRRQRTFRVYNFSLFRRSKTWYKSLDGRRKEAQVVTLSFARVIYKSQSKSSTWEARRRDEPTLDVFSVFETSVSRMLSTDGRGREPISGPSPPKIPLSFLSFNVRNRSKLLWLLHSGRRSGVEEKGQYVYVKK